MEHSSLMFVKGVAKGFDVGTLYIYTVVREIFVRAVVYEIFHRNI